MIYAYARVSTKTQNLDRQVEAFNARGVDIILTEKQSGKDFDSRNVYQKMKKKLKAGDLLVIASLDRLGRNYEQIVEEWYELTTKGVDIEVLDMPILNTRSQVEGLDGKFISNLVLQILSYVAQKEREKIKERQRQGIDIAMAKGVKFGRPKKELPTDYQEIISNYIKGEITNIECHQKLGISRGQLFRMLKDMDYKKEPYLYRPKRLSKADYVAMWQRNEISLDDLREKTKLSDIELMKLIKPMYEGTKKMEEN